MSAASAAAFVLPRRWWAYARPYASETERVGAYEDWLHRYNHHRGHTALGGRPPASRVTNSQGSSQPQPGVSTRGHITPDSRISALADAWYVGLRDLFPTTMEAYLLSGV